MAARRTEDLHDAALGLDQRPSLEIASILAEGQIEATTAVRAALPTIAEAASAMAATVRDGGRLHYVAAGSSGLMAAADAQELGGTFGIAPAQLRIHMAGGLPTGVEMPGETEDATNDLGEALSALSPRDTMIAVSASGATPYTLAAADIAKTQGATLIAIANNRDAPLLEMADHAILLQTPPEVLSGSTRMGAGTAQKVALNMLSTLMAVALGHVHDGMMVNVRADNIKLRDRANRIVQQVADVPEETAREALEAAGGHVKPAVLIAARGLSLTAARDALSDTGGHLRPALDRTR
ncbi:MAG: N-acetylmuramic acid 6-phosphate etherase [Pseudomonadota bacterium]